MNTKIDFVIPWVDGNDPLWQQQKREYEAADLGIIDSSDVRYRDWDNLQYWFRGVEKYAPWVHQIYFVTWGHVPKWLDVHHEKLTIVRHEDYIPAEYLPTFNVNPIELNLHRIPGLSEHFVYFNDDIFPVRDVKPEDFFVDGLPCDYAVESPITPNRKDVFNDILINNMIFLNRFYDRREILKRQKRKFYSPADKKGLVTNLAMSVLRRHDFFGFGYAHLSANFLKSSLEALWEMDGDELDKVCRNRFRSADDVNQYLISEYQYVNGLFHPRSWDRLGKAIQLDDSDAEEVRQACRTIVHGKDKVLCINDTDVHHFDKTKKMINKAFEKLLPEKSSFEV